MSTTKPPLGLKPKNLHDDERLFEVVEAIKRRLEALQSIPVEWLAEYQGLVINYAARPAKAKARVSIIPICSTCSSISCGNRSNAIDAQCPCTELYRKATNG